MKKSRDIEATLEAMIQHDRMETTAAYLNRGRSLQYLCDDDLKSGWTAAFRTWYSTDSSADRLLLDNYEGELALREIDPPNETIAAEMEDARAKIARDGPGNPGIRDAIRRFLEARENEH